MTYDEARQFATNKARRKRINNLNRVNTFFEAVYAVTDATRLELQGSVYERLRLMSIEKNIAIISFLMMFPAVSQYEASALFGISRETLKQKLFLKTKFVESICAQIKTEYLRLMRLQIEAMQKEIPSLSELEIISESLKAVG